MAYGTALKLIPMTSTGFAAIGAGYVPLGLPLPIAVQEVIITSSLNTAVIISMDGVTDMIFLAAGGTFPYLADGLVFPNGLSAVPQGTQFYVKQAVGAPASGSVFLMGAFVH